jgi:hypothetical protein
LDTDISSLRFAFATRTATRIEQPLFAQNIVISSALEKQSTMRFQAQYLCLVVAASSAGAFVAPRVSHAVDSELGEANDQGEPLGTDVMYQVRSGVNFFRRVVGRRASFGILYDTARR